MARKPDTPCAGCGKLLWSGTTSLPAGLRTCRGCRGLRHATSSRVERIRSVNVGRTCADALGCDRPARKRGLCNTHYNRANGYTGGWKAYVPSPEAAERRRVRDRDKTRRRRALARGATAEVVDRDVVGVRDGWRCGICRRKVDRALVWPHPMSPTLDHVVPIAEGGDHTYANVRIAHLDCNVARRDRGGNEQLALIG